MNTTVTKDAEETLAALLRDQVRVFNEDKNKKPSRPMAIDCAFLLPPLALSAPDAEKPNPAKSIQPVTEYGPEALRVVSLHYAVSKAAILGKSREQSIVFARRCLVAVLRDLGWTFSKCGKFINRDHSTCVELSNRFYLEADETEKAYALDISAHVAGKKRLDLEGLKAKAKARSKSYNAKFCGYMIIYSLVSKLAPQNPTRKSFVEYRYALRRCMCVLLTHYAWRVRDIGEFLDLSEVAVRKHVTFYNEHKSFDELLLITEVIEAVETMRRRLLVEKELS
jgi:hypothetical protein